MNSGAAPHEDNIVEMMSEDMIDMLSKRDVNQRSLVEFDEKWSKAGASSDARKLARLLASSLGAYQAGQRDSMDRLAQEFITAAKMLPDVAGGAREVRAAEAALVTPEACASYALIMKGGGIKGLAYVGAIELLARRYPFNWYVGTSAGAVTAVLLGAGYTADELRQILRGKDFRDFFDASRWKKWANLVFHRGLHPADTLTEWLDTLLAEKLRKPSRVLLSDLPCRVTVYASQRNRQALKFDSRDNDAAASYAVRCSMSIPFFFIPQSHQGVRAFDGGLQHNYPVNDLLATYPGTPFISLYLGSEVYEPVRQRGIIPDLISIWTESTDAEVVNNHRANTVIIDPRPVGTLDFALTDIEKEFLLACGRAGALAHLSNGEKEHLDAQSARNALKAEVERARRMRRARERVRRYLVSVVCYTLIAALVWCFWLNSVPVRSRSSEDAPTGPRAKEDGIKNRSGISPWTYESLR